MATQTIQVRTTHQPARMMEPSTTENTFSKKQIKPVIKLSPEGMLLYANSRGVAFLEVVHHEFRMPPVKYLISQYPELLDPACSVDVCIRIKNVSYYFSAVAFTEAGYIGLYGYHNPRHHAGKSETH